MRILIDYPETNARALAVGVMGSRLYCVALLHSALQLEAFNGPPAYR
jgi:hypothetical protein